MKIKIIVISLLMILGLGVLLESNTATAVSCPKGSVQKTANTLAECNIEDTEENALMNTIKNIINVILGIIGVVSVVMIIIGGISYTTSQGDTSKTKKAKDTILYSVIGLVVALLAFAIVNFVLKGVFGSQ